MGRFIQKTQKIKIYKNFFNFLGPQNLAVFGVSEKPENRAIFGAPKNRDFRYTQKPVIFFSQLPERLMKNFF